MGYITYFGTPDLQKYKIMVRKNQGYTTNISVSDFEVYDILSPAYRSGYYLFGVLCNDGYTIPMVSFRYKVYQHSGATPPGTKPSSAEYPITSLCQPTDSNDKTFLIWSQNFSTYSWAIDLDIINQYITGGQRDATVTIYGIISNATANFSGTTTYPIDSEQTLTITADSGYYFPRAGSQAYHFYFNETRLSVDVPNYETFATSSDGYTLTWTGKIINNVWFDDSYVAELYPTSTIGIYTHIFALTQDELNSLARLTFLKVTTSEYPSIEQTYSEYNKYILALYKLPFGIPDIIRETTPKAVPLGAIITDIRPVTLSHWTMDISGGTVTVPLKYSNVYDYINTDCTLYVPYYGFVSVSNSYIIGKSVSIEYHVNLLNGMVTIDILDSGTQTVIDKLSKSVRYDMPFYQMQYNAVSDTSMGTPLIEDNLTAFVTVRRNSPYYPDGFYGKVNYTYETVSSLPQGLHQILDIIFTGDIPDEMQSEIRTIMQEGFVI